MGEYADVKRQKMLRLLKRLETLPGFTIGNGGNHQWIVKHKTWERPFPIPFKHNNVNKHIVKTFMNQVIATGVCSKEIFDFYLK